MLFLLNCLQIITNSGKLVTKKASWVMTESFPLFPHLPKQLSSETLVDIRGKRFVADTLELENGDNYTYYSLHTTDTSVMVVAFTEDGHLVLNKEYRHPTRQILLSLPGGLVDHGESNEEAAKRELLEETGYIAKNVTFLGASYPFPGISPQKTHYFLAERVILKKKPALEPCEILETFLIQKNELEQAIRSGAEVDSHLLTGLTFLTLKNT